MSDIGAVFGFVVCFMGSIFGTLIGIVRLWLCIGAAKLNADFGTKYRNKKFTHVVIHFIVCAILFYIAFRISLANL